jgi:hypothetical protein
MIKKNFKSCNFSGNSIFPCRQKARKEGRSFITHVVANGKISERIGMLGRRLHIEQALFPLHRPGKVIPPRIPVTS